ncbi:hypothetical protein [Spirillospora sp. NPDC047279]|uniref:hypothetical protein n=1 Tax=Spirillospora sp. NPDC047279 TaxID=3155478 RepID=UPI0034119CC0
MPFRNSGQSSLAEARRRGRAASCGGMVALRRTHLIYVFALVTALGLRALAVLGYPSVLWFGDSVTYLRDALDLAPSKLRPSGYSVFLRSLAPLHSFTFVVIVQHLLGIATGTMLYALVRRASLAAWPDRPWRAALLGTAAAVPILFDAYQIELEHLLMSDALFICLTVAAVTLLLWRRRPTWWLGALAGLALAAATVTRTVGLPLIFVFVLYLLLRRVSWRTIGATAAVFTLGVAAYAGWYKAEHGEYALSNTTGFFLYGRTAAFADCDVIQPPPELARMCRDWRTYDTAVAPGYSALWGPDSPFKKIRGGIAGDRADRLGTRFAKHAIAAQPLGYLQAVARDTARSFAWTRSAYPTVHTAAEYRFPKRGWRLSGATALSDRYGGATARPRVVEPAAGLIRAYQSFAYLPGTLLAALLLAALTGLVRNRLGGPALLAWLTAATLLLVPPLIADFDYRYVLPVIPFAALAALLAFIPEQRAKTQKVIFRFRAQEGICNTSGENLNRV